MKYDWSPESAMMAYKQSQLKNWVIKFLGNTPGSNPGLVKHIRDHPNLIFQEPTTVELAQLVPISGRPEDKRKFNDPQWDARIDKMVADIKTGWNPPPLIITNYWGQENALSDGNHRWAALIKAGYGKYWAIYFSNQHRSDKPF